MDAAFKLSGLLRRQDEIVKRLGQQGELISLVTETHTEIEEVISSRALDRQALAEKMALCLAVEDALKDHAPEPTFEEKLEHARRNLDRARAFNGKPPLHGAR